MPEILNIIRVYIEKGNTINEVMQNNTSCSGSAIWKSSSSSEYSSSRAEFLCAAFWSIEVELTEISFVFWLFFEEADVENILTMTGILGGAFLSSDWANHSRKPVEREKIKHFETLVKHALQQNKTKQNKKEYKMGQPPFLFFLLTYIHAYIFVCIYRGGYEKPTTLSIQEKTVNHIQENQLTGYTI